MAFAAVAPGWASIENAATSSEREFGEDGIPPAVSASLEASQPVGSPNPYLNYLPATSEYDYPTWRRRVQQRSHQRAYASVRDVERGPAFSESENNNLLIEADAIPGLVAEGPIVTINGTTDVQALWANVITAPDETNLSNNDGLSDATFVSVGSGARQRIQGTIGYGSVGIADQDYYRLSLVAGDSLTVDVDTVSGIPDTAVAIIAEFPYGILDFTFSNPYAGSFDPDAYASATAPYTGTFWVAVSSTSGTGDYELRLGRNTGVDLFSVDLEPGDVIGVASSVSLELEILGPSGQARFGSAMAISDLLPADSPLPKTATGAEASDVAAVSGTHYVRVRAVREAPQAYTLDVRVLRPGPERQGSQQVLFLDFDGASLDADALFEAGPAYSNVTLSPLADFLDEWGLVPADENDVIDAVLATVEENLLDLELIHPGASFELRNSRDDADPFGDAGVSRVVIGGTRAQLGRDTIGVAEFIDPGNFSLEDTAVVLLDILSETNTAAPHYLSSLNRFTLSGGVDKVDLVGLGVGSIAAHEIGHYLGLWHTDVQSATLALGDQGGNLAGLLGSNDLIIGDGDDVDVDFVTDVLTPGSGLRGVEDQGGRTAFALSRGSLIFADGFEGGGVGAWQ